MKTNTNIDSKQNQCIPTAITINRTTMQQLNEEYQSNNIIDDNTNDNNKLSVDMAVDATILYVILKNTFKMNDKES